MKPLGAAEMAGRLSDGVRVFCGRLDALENFGETRDDFLKSFWCPILLYPLAMAAIYRADSMSSDVPFGTWVLAETSFYAIAFVYWPLAMAYISILLGKPDNWARYVVASNWIVVTPILLQIGLLLSIDYSAGTAGIGLFLLAIQIWSFIIGGLILRRLFETNLPMTVLLLLSDFILSRAFDWVKQWALLTAA